MLSNVRHVFNLFNCITCMCFVDITYHFYWSNCESVSSSRRGKALLPMQQGWGNMNTNHHDTF